MNYKACKTPINVDKGKTPEGYSKCESTKVCAGKQIDNALKPMYRANQDYRLPRNPDLQDHFMDKKD